MKKKSTVLIIILIILAVAGGTFCIGYFIPHSQQHETPFEILSEDALNSNEPIYVIGHKNNDLDTLCSSIAVAEFFQKQGYNTIAAVCGEICPVGKYILDKFGKEYPTRIDNVEGKKVIIVDHNEYSNGVDGLDKANILAIIDHHKLGGIKTQSSIFTYIEPIGATATIVYKLYAINNVEMDKNTEKIILSAILDDTLNLRLETTTPSDIKAVDTLIEKTGIYDTDALYSEIVKVETNYENMTDEEILHAKEKSYPMGDYNVKISIINVSSEKEMEEMAQRMKEYLRTIPLQDDKQHIYVLINDLISFAAELIYYGDNAEDFIFNVYPPNSEGRILFDSVPSRKENIVPNLTREYEKLMHKSK